MDYAPGRGKVGCPLSVLSPHQTPVVVSTGVTVAIIQSLLKRAAFSRCTVTLRGHATRVPHLKCMCAPP